MQKIVPFLWFDKNAEEAMQFYTSVFKDSKIVDIRRYPEGVTDGPMAGFGGKVLTGTFELEGQRFMCLDGGPVFKPPGATSFMVMCKDQAEIDYYWEKLSAVPEKEQCGWLTDKFGFPWQVIPENMGELIKSPKALEAMLTMKKIDIATLKAAA